MNPTPFLSRYRSYLAVVVAVAALAVFAPEGRDLAVSVGGGDQVAGADPTDLDSGSVPTRRDGDQTGPPGSRSVTTRSVTGTGAAPLGPGGDRDPGAGPSPLPASADALDNPDCDPATGRIRVPSLFAPPCVGVFSGSNGGSTYQGVTAETIKVVYFQAETDPAVDAALTAAGANNTPEEQRATMSDYVDYFNDHYELYGRKVELVIRQGSGDTDDDAVGRADALAIATEDKPFAVFGAPAANSFVEELAVHQILCVCTTSQPQEVYERLAPYVGYTTLMASTQGYIHRAEYVGKRLAGRAAVHAGTSDGLPMNSRQRVFGLLWYDTPAQSYASGVRFFEQHLRDVYGVELAESLSYPSDYQATAERTRALIQRLKGAGVTSVIFSGDPIAPALFTQEATRQAYFPEWIVTGSALTDTSLFARTFDTQQWQRAFGVSFLTAKIPAATTDGYKLHVWHHGRPPTAANQYGVIYPTPFTFFTGVHLAGPDLTVESWQRGLFSYPVTGRGMVTSATRSYGDHGLWPFVDYTNYDDVTEIWWDPNAVGEDEVGNPGRGMYRYVSGGRRYLPGEHPSSDPVVFTSVESAPTEYSTPPPGEEPPEYEHPEH